MLIVDDDQPTLAGLRDLLRLANFTVHAATSGQEAVRIATEQLPDAVLLDVMMPDASGFDLCSRLKQHPSTRLIPIVLMTGMHSPRLRIDGLAAGADDIMTKPLNVEELRVRGRSLVRLTRLTSTRR